eukprot:1157936-Pelagomonas_calceolata.AAC.16
MAAIGRPDMSADNPQFATNNDRCKHVDLIMSEISKYCAEHTLGEVCTLVRLLSQPDTCEGGKESRGLLTRALTSACVRVACQCSRLGFPS